MNNTTQFWAYLGEGIGVSLIILSLCFGIGGCLYLSNKKPNQPQVILTNNSSINL